LQLDLFRCVHNATGDLDGAMRAMCGARDGTVRIKAGVRLGRPGYQPLCLVSDCAKPYVSTDQRNAARAPWVDDYNLNRPHAGIGGVTPRARVNNLFGNNS